MSVSKRTIEQFSKILADNVKEKKAGTSNIIGTLRLIGEKKYVQIDGSDMLTPCYEASGALNGDRVLVSMENHKITVIGNFTNPPEANSAVNIGNGLLTIYQGEDWKGSFQANQSNNSSITLDPIPINVSEFQNDVEYVKKSEMDEVIAGLLKRIEALEKGAV